MDRTALANWIARVFADLLDLSGTPATDTADGFKFVLDQVQDVYTDRPGLSPRFQRDIASYFMLTYFDNMFMSIPVTQVDGDSYNFYKAIDSIQDRLEQLRKRIGSIVEPEDPDDGFFGTPITVRNRFLTNGAEGSEWQ